MIFFIIFWHLYIKNTKVSSSEFLFKVLIKLLNV